MMRYLAITLLAAVAALAGPAGAQKPFLHNETAGRVQLMQSNKDALGQLTAMMGGQVHFNRSQARAARRSLIRNTRKVEKAFRKQKLEPLSHARPAIWADWSGFTEMADAAAGAAAGLRSNTLPGLRETLPDLIRTCHACHERFRQTPREFTTH